MNICMTLTPHKLGSVEISGFQIPRLATGIRRRRNETKQITSRNESQRRRETLAPASHLISRFFRVSSINHTIPHSDTEIRSKLSMRQARLPLSRMKVSLTLLCSTQAAQHSSREETF